MSYPGSLKVEQLDQRHPDYDGDGLAQRRALYAGGRAWRALLDAWLPQHEVEPADAWRFRKAQATYENHFGPALDLLSGHLFADPPRLEDAPDGDYWARLTAGHGSGVGWASWWRERVTEALWAGRAWVWLDLPAGTGAAASLGDQVRSGALDAYLRSFDPEAVIDWATDDLGVAWVRARQIVERADGPVSPRTRVYRWTCIDQHEIAEYEWAPTGDRTTPSPEDLAYLREGYPVAHGWAHPDTRAPACPVYDLLLDGALSAGERMQDPAISHLRGRNEQQHALFRAAVVILWLRAKWGAARATALGQGAFLQLTRDQDGADEAGFLEPPGGVFEHLGADCKRREEALYRVVGQMAVAIDPSAAASGDSKRQDWRAMEVVLSALAGVTLDAMRWVVGMIAALRREDAPTVAGLDGWHREETPDWLTGVAMAPELKTSPTARRLIAVEQARRLLPDASPDDLQAIEDELQQAAEADAGMMRPPGMGGAGGVGGQPGAAPGPAGPGPGAAD